MVQTIASLVSIPVLSIVVALAFYRLVRGPSTPDRVVALDLITAVGMAIIATYALITGVTAFLDVAIVVALITFIGTVAFAYYIERRV